MFVELHILQNFAPSNLNRDDTGSPKDCEFGGYRRARISSQCLKRALRTEPGFERFLIGRGGVRTRRLIVEIAEAISEQSPAPKEVADLVSKVFNEGGIERPTTKKGATEEDNTKLIIFLARGAIGEMTECFRKNWSALQSKGKDTNKAILKELGDVLVEGAKVPDIALYGRMLAIDGAKPFGKLQLGVDAACQVAHALSTNQVSMEFDFFTAVDDLNPADTVGAGMLGTVEFNSACFYRYANVDLNQLQENLGGDRELAELTLEAFLRASVAAIPTGKQNSMAAQNPPSLVLAVVRQSGLWSLANAFTRPVRPNHEGDLVQRSMTALDGYWSKLTRMYGEAGIAGSWVCTLEEEGLKNLADARVDDFDALVAGVMATVRSESDAGALA